MSYKYTVNSYNSSSYGFKSFQGQGALLLTDLKNQDLYINARSKNHRSFSTCSDGERTLLALLYDGGVGPTTCFFLWWISSDF